MTIVACSPATVAQRKAAPVLGFTVVATFPHESVARHVRVATKVFPQNPPVFVTVLAMTMVTFVPSHRSLAVGRSKGHVEPHATVRAGAHVIDVCLANPDREEKADMVAFFEKVVRKVKVPFMIDSTDAAVMEEALKRAPGKCILNSVNLEDGRKRIDAVVPAVREYGLLKASGNLPYLASIHTVRPEEAPSFQAPSRRARAGHDGSQLNGIGTSNDRAGAASIPA